MNEAEKKYFIWFGKKVDSSFMKYYEREPFGAGILVGCALGTSVSVSLMFIAVLLIF